MLHTIILQITTVGEGAMVPDKTTMSFIDLLLKGGIIMIPIFLLSLISVYIFTERYLLIKKISTSLDGNLMSQINQYLKAKDIQGALDYCNTCNTTTSMIIERGILRLGKPLPEIESSMTHVAGLIVNNLEKNINILSAIATIAPMLGFLGTIFGMIKAFHNISLANNISIGLIAGGIYEKMISSAAGIIVGVIAYILLTILNSMIDRKILNIEKVCLTFLDALQRK